MPKDIKEIKDSIMDQIKNDKVKMKPRIYFVLGSILAFIGLVSSFVISIFLIGLIRFSLRSHGPMGAYRFESMLSSFPWWAPILAVIGLVLGIWLMRRYDFSFKVDFKSLVIGILLAVIVGGVVVDMLGFNDALVRRGPMRGMMKEMMRGNIER